MYETEIKVENTEIDGNLIDDLGWKNEEKLLDSLNQKSAFLKFKDGQLHCAACTGLYYIPRRLCIGLIAALILAGFCAILKSLKF